VNYNKVVLAGRIANPPKYHGTGATPVINFTVAYNRRKKDGGDEASFFNCKAFGRTADFVQKYFGKGAAILVEGTLKQETWDDKEGQKRSTVVIMVDQAFFAGRKGEGEDPGAAPPSAKIPGMRPGKDYIDQPPAAGDDDMPF
jgi:single-strand DNA-binding protein